MHYRVKFICEGELHYGLVDYTSPKAKEVMARGLLLVEDAVFPQTWEVNENRLMDIPLSDEKQWEDFICLQHKIASEISDTTVGIEPGKLVYFGIGNGGAWYVVTATDKKYSTLEWRGFDSSRLLEPVLGYEGLMNTQRLENYLKIEASLNRLKRNWRESV